jgi:hypothetical protein
MLGYRSGAVANTVEPRDLFRFVRLREPFPLLESCGGRAISAVLRTDFGGNPLSPGEIFVRTSPAEVLRQFFGLPDALSLTRRIALQKSKVSVL